VKHVFRNGSRSRVIDLPGVVRKIRSISFRYGNLSAYGQAKVAVYGRDVPVGASRPDPNYRPEPGPGPRPGAWSSRGWARLGSADVRGRRDRDSIRVGRVRGGFKAITVQVDGGDLEMHDVVVTFGNGQKFSPKVRHRFREGSRTRLIDLPGNRRQIRRIDFRYGNLPGSGRANVTVWAR
jgi:hypothetical protein